MTTPTPASLAASAPPAPVHRPARELAGMGDRDGSAWTRKGPSVVRLGAAQLGWGHVTLGVRFGDVRAEVRLSAAALRELAVDAAAKADLLDPPAPPEIGEP